MRSRAHKAGAEPSEGEKNRVDQAANLQLNPPSPERLKSPSFLSHTASPVRLPSLAESVASARHLASATVYLIPGAEKRPGPAISAPTIGLEPRKWVRGASPKIKRSFVTGKSQPGEQDEHVVHGRNLDENPPCQSAGKGDLISRRPSHRSGSGDRVRTGHCAYSAIESNQPQPCHHGITRHFRSQYHHILLALSSIEDQLAR